MFEALRSGLINKQTFWLGVVTIVSTVLTSVVTPLVDNDPDTAIQVTQLSAGVAAGLGLIFARDANKSSTRSRAK